ncbi:hypothetical protein K402DRAFT_401560 [Aulographum hederae CBS 113979]|uniref:Uncharacterized protein n=1 Tax=Aulographum hederae CBS 113979 TaxID=1176131 RepID=A0A6G1HAP3_9PEZI|nr:hypothetical protein K402DRAFT_401560 [Aulographum hederae CBS 113979]
MVETTQVDDEPKILLTIPGELRNYIWEYLFETSEIVGAANLGLLLTCKQIYKETRGIAFANTTFIVRNTKTNQPWEPVSRGVKYTMKNLKLLLTPAEILHFFASTHLTT